MLLNEETFSFGRSQRYNEFGKRNLQDSYSNKGHRPFTELTVLLTSCPLHHTQVAHSTIFLFPCLSSSSSFQVPPSPLFGGVLVLTQHRFYLQSHFLSLSNLFPIFVLPKCTIRCLELERVFCCLVRDQNHPLPPHPSFPSYWEELLKYSTQLTRKQIPRIMCVLFVQPHQQNHKSNSMDSVQPYSKLNDINVPIVPKFFTYSFEGETIDIIISQFTCILVYKVYLLFYQLKT